MDTYTAEISEGGCFEADSLISLRHNIAEYYAQDGDDYTPAISFITLPDDSELGVPALMKFESQLAEEIREIREAA